MKLLTFAAIAAMSVSAAAFAQSTTPVQPNANPNNCSPAFPNCTGDEGGNKTPGNTPGTYRNELKQEDKIPQTATEPDLPMKQQNCGPGQVNCVPNANSGPATALPRPITR